MWLKLIVQCNNFGSSMFWKVGSECCGYCQRFLGFFCSFIVLDELLILAAGLRRRFDCDLANLLKVLFTKVP